MHKLNSNHFSNPSNCIEVIDNENDISTPIMRNIFLFFVSIASWKDIALSIVIARPTIAIVIVGTFFLLLEQIAIVKKR